MRKSCVRAMTILVLGLSAMGCGDGGAGAAKRANVYKASGKVTFLGSPLIGAVVTFAPQEKQPPAIGMTDDAGEFTLTTYNGGDGAAEGEFKVTVIKSDASADAAPAEAHGKDANWSPPANAHAGGKGKSSSSLLPAKFGDLGQTPLTAKVEPSGENKFTFEIK